MNELKIVSFYQIALLSVHLLFWCILVHTIQFNNNCGLANKVTSIHDKNHYTCKCYKRLAIQSIIQYISEKKLKNEGKLRYKKLDAFKHGSNWMHVNDSPEGRIKCQLQTPRHHRFHFRNSFCSHTMKRKEPLPRMCTCQNFILQYHLIYYTVPCVFLLTHTIICQIQYQSRGY